MAVYRETKQRCQDAAHTPAHRAGSQVEVEGHSGLPIGLQDRPVVPLVRAINGMRAAYRSAKLRPAMAVALTSDRPNSSQPVISRRSL